MENIKKMISMADNKNIGIISYHREPNYGTMLQAYALAEAIRKNGFNCEYIDYYESTKPSFLRTSLRAIYHFLGFPSRGEFGFFDTKRFRGIRDAFEFFHKKYIPVSKKKFYFDTLASLSGSYDFFITGSDQTWSPAMNQSPYSINFLPFVNSAEKKRSYAPSIGTICINENFQSRLIKELCGYSFLSCRERPNCEKLSKLIGKKITYVLDPTLLLTTDDWDAIAKPAIVDEDYILAYILGTKQCIADYAERLGSETGLPVYYIITRPEYLSKTNTLDCIGPQDFIGLIKGAKYVVTDSFHGTLFSINYNKEFYSFSKREDDVKLNDNDRIVSFLSELGIEGRFIKDSDSHNLIGINPIDYEKVNKILNGLRSESREYLDRLLVS